MSDTDSTTPHGFDDFQRFGYPEPVGLIWVNPVHYVEDIDPAFITNPEPPEDSGMPMLDHLFGDHEGIECTCEADAGEQTGAG